MDGEYDRILPTSQAAVAGAKYLPLVTHSIEIRSYTRYDAFVAVGSTDGKWELSVQGQDLTDEENYVTGIVSIPTPGMALLRPRTRLAALRFRL